MAQSAESINGNQPDGIQRAGVQSFYLESRRVLQIVDSDLTARILDKGRGCSFRQSLDVIDGWKAEGRLTVFQAGGFDLLTINHTLGLQYTRIAAAMVRLGISSISSEAQLALVHTIASSNDLALMVTSDTNDAISGSKSRNSEKGDSLRPILDWETRARMLALQSIPTPQAGIRRNLVDFVTTHGPGCCNNCASGSCVNESNAHMVLHLQPDVVIVNADSKNTVEEMTRYEKEGKLPNTTVVIIQETDLQYSDPLLEGPVKTSNIVRRIRS